MTKDTEQINAVHVCLLRNKVCNIKKWKKAYRIYNSNISLSGVSSKPSGSSTSSSHSRKGPGVWVDECEADVVEVAKLLLKNLEIGFCFVCFFFSL